MNDIQTEKCTFCEWNGTNKTCFAEPLTYITSDDQDHEDRFEVGPGCVGFINQQVVFIMPNSVGWVEIGQHTNMQKNPIVRLINIRPTEDLQFDDTEISEKYELTNELWEK